MFKTGGSHSSAAQRLLCKIVKDRGKLFLFLFFFNLIEENFFEFKFKAYFRDNFVNNNDVNFTSK